MGNETVQMSADERAEFEKFKAEKAKKEAAVKAKENRETYKRMVDEEINAALPELQFVSNNLKAAKSKVFGNFKSILAMKAEIVKVKDEQRSHTFTNSDGTCRITLGNYVTDDYRDTVNDGIAIVTEYIQSLAKDENSAALVKAVMRLLARDKKGTLKASRVLQLRQMADESNSDRFRDGVKIIEESYQPAVSKTFIRAQVKNEQGAWVDVPLGMSEV